MINIITLLILTFMFVFPTGNLLAEIKAIEESCEYVMGDNDSKIDAKRLCLIEAKRKVLERVGTYVESSTNILNFNITRDEIKAYTAGLIKTNIISEKTTFNGQNTVIRMKIQTKVDTTVLETKMLEIHKDNELSIKYKKMEDDYKNLEKKIRQLQDKLRRSTDSVAVDNVRLERENAFNKLSSLEEVKLDIKQKTYVAVQNVTMGMTIKEVIDLIGPPRSTTMYPSLFQHLNYGNVWVVIENGIVTLLVDAGCFQASFSRSNYFSIVNPCGAGKGIIKY